MVTLTDYGQYRMDMARHAVSRVHAAVDAFLATKDQVSDTTGNAALTMKVVSTTALHHWVVNGAPSEATVGLVGSAVRHLLEFPIPLPDHNAEWAAILEHMLVFGDIYNGAYDLSVWLSQRPLAEGSQPMDRLEDNDDLEMRIPE